MLFSRGEEAGKSVNVKVFYTKFGLWRRRWWRRRKRLCYMYITVQWNPFLCISLLVRTFCEANHKDKPWYCIPGAERVKGLSLSCHFQYYVVNKVFFSFLAAEIGNKSNAFLQRKTKAVYRIISFRRNHANFRRGKDRIMEWTKSIRPSTMHVHLSDVFHAMMEE